MTKRGFFLFWGIADTLLSALAVWFAFRDLQKNWGTQGQETGSTFEQIAVLAVLTLLAFAILCACIRGKFKFPEWRLGHTLLMLLTGALSVPAGAVLCWFCLFLAGA